MFLFWLGLFFLCCIVEQIKDSIDAYKYHQKGGFYAECPCFKPKKPKEHQEKQDEK